MVISEFPASEISAIIGVSEAAVIRWVKVTDEQGFDALRPKGHKGTSPKLTDEQYKEIGTAIQTDPKIIGYKSGPNLSAHILRSRSFIPMN